MRLTDGDIRSTLTKTGMSAGAIVGLGVAVAALTYLIYSFIR